jgi:NADH-quinone oxidoreductase subunit A
MAQYLPLLVMLILASLFAGGSFFASGLLAPKRPTPAKAAPYECGIVPDKEPAERFPVRFYLVAMIFIIFDIEIIFLYPWAVIFRQLKGFGILEMVLFTVAVFVSLVYLMANGALDWGPAKRLMPASTTDLGGGARDPGRTSASTVRRVGPTGREAA